MDLISKIKLEKPLSKISYGDNLLFMGSCFSGNIGLKFQENLFSTMINPFGVIFNPISIFNLLKRSINKDYFVDEDWIFHNGKWINLDLHGKFSFSDLDQAKQNSNSLINATFDFLKSADHLFITYGTAWVYEYLSNEKLVANCHKIPQKEFRKYLLTPEEILSKTDEVLKLLSEFNPKVNLVFTVSPVRHWGDGARNNNLSKGVLHYSISESQKLIKSDYFPSYEIIMDELRDYRFFTEDMMHPNNLAIDYVWEKIQDVYIDSKTATYLKRVEKLISASMHRPFDSDSKQYQDFIVKQLDDLSKLKKEIKTVDFDSLEYQFKSKLKKN